MRGRVTLLFYIVFFATGFSALTLQVVWQRVISLHAGVDLVSFTTVVAAFLAGLGIGSLLGGWLADRLGPRRSVLAFAISNLAIGLFAWLSTWLFYDVYSSFAQQLSSTATSFAFNFVMLLVPTTLMGLSLPLVARAIVGSIDDAGPLVGRLYSVNTFGAAAGAAVAGWFLLGNFGFVATTRFAGLLNLLAAAILLTQYRRTSGDEAAEPRVGVATGSNAGDPVATGARAWPWFVIYGITGAVALGFEVVFFRVIDVTFRSNSYTFAHVLSVYLFLFAVGAAVASRVVGRIKRPDLWFLWLQFFVGVAALAGLVFLVRVLGHTPWGDGLQEHLAGEGFATGFDDPEGSDRGLRVLFAAAPLIVMAVPVLFMGAAFPFAQALVTQRVETLGRRTGLLLFTNIVGNVTGTLLVGFVLIDAVGTAGTYRLLAVALLVPGLAAAFLAAHHSRRIPLAVGAVVLLGLVLVVSPSNERLWAYLHGTTTAQLDLAEDRSCVTALREQTGIETMKVNGSSQNGYPFDDFHLLLGLAPALVHDDPLQGMALGMGIGATPYGMSLDPRLENIENVELCGGQVPLLQNLADRGAIELQRFFDDPRVDVVVGDGRDHLLTSDTEFDVVVVDTLRPQAAFSGNLYSVEFYELVADSLAEDGLLTQWAPTARSLNSITEVFPYALRFSVPNYFNQQFIVASKSPITFDREAILERFDDIPIVGSAVPDTHASLRSFFETAEPECIINGDRAPISDGGLNHDLQPRDEYFLNNDYEVEGRATCG